MRKSIMNAWNRDRTQKMRGCIFAFGILCLIGPILQIEKLRFQKIRFIPYDTRLMSHRKHSSLKLVKC